ncbi:MAG: GH3 auxin-responsive promoter family protein [Treponema sp.]|nr:GH3 auxin-responsive promoter family protein [Treponema sp.]
MYESEIESENSRVCQLNEVKAGERRCAPAANSAGLYRSNLNDILEVAGRRNQFPQKCNGVINISDGKLRAPVHRCGSRGGESPVPAA